MSVRTRTLLCRENINKHRLFPLWLEGGSCKWMKLNEQTENRWKRKHPFFLKEKHLHASLQIWQPLVSCRLCFCLPRDGWITIFDTTYDHVWWKGSCQVPIGAGRDLSSTPRTLQQRKLGEVARGVDPLLCRNIHDSYKYTLYVQIRNRSQGDSLWLCSFLSLLVQELKSLVLQLVVKLSLSTA